MAVVYVYALNTLADWEIGNLIAEIHSRRFFKKDAREYEVRFVGSSKEDITSMGGITITPADVVDDIVPGQGDILVLPGADTWNESVHIKAIQKAKEFLEKGAVVAAICGATVALANAGMLNERPHTSNGVGFLDMFVKDYNGEAYYVDCPSVVDDNLITAACTGGLLFTKQILQKMNVMEDAALEYWYEYFRTGSAYHFFQLMKVVNQ